MYQYYYTMKRQFHQLNCIINAKNARTAINRAARRSKPPKGGDIPSDVPAFFIFRPVCPRQIVPAFCKVFVHFVVFYEFYTDYN